MPDWNGQPQNRIDQNHFTVPTFIDILYDYHAFAAGGPIGTSPTTTAGEVCIVGAGAAGLCAGYELLRSGVVPTILEAGSRIGGRNWSLPFTNSYSCASSAFAEMGAMRFPSSSRLLWHYATDCFDLETIDAFPDPGIVDTMLCVKGRKIHWPAGTQDSPPPPFDRIALDWSNFIHSMTAPLMAAWEQGKSSEVVDHWQSLIDRFVNVSFYDTLVRGIPQWEKDDIFLFGQLGIGSGGFAPLYNIGFLEILRIVINQLEIEQRGIVSGISALDHGFHRRSVPIRGSNTSLDQLGAVRLNSTVTQIRRDSRNGWFEVTWKSGTNYRKQTFRTVIVAAPTSAMQMMGLGHESGPCSGLLTPAQNAAIRDLHMTRSSKLFIRTATKFWKNGAFPQNIQTDQLPRGVYCLDYPQTENGVVLVSYTWEDDSQKLQALKPEDRFSVLRDQLAVDSPEFAAALDPVNGEILSIDWQDQPGIHGAFKLNLPGQEAANAALFYQFQHVKAGEPALILAGDGVSWSGGWVEGALQTGLQAACAALRSVGGKVRSNSPLEMQQRFTY